jgi:hypothetical protein
VGAPKNEIYFDLDGTATIPALMNLPDFGTSLKTAMQSAFEIPQESKENSAKFYEFNQIDVNHILRAALRKVPAEAALPAVLGLLLFELDLIEANRESGHEARGLPRRGHDRSVEGREPAVQLWRYIRAGV